jgi:hypothetical protein
MLNTLEMAHNSFFSGDMDSIENPDRSLESEIYLMANSDGQKEN